MNYLIRNATAQDVAGIIRLERESATAAHWTEQQYQSSFVGDLSFSERLLLVAGKGESDEILGFLVARHVSEEWELENIVVSEGNRGNGIGTALLDELLLRAQRSQSHSLFLEVRESNLAARALYAKSGFEEIGRRKGYYSNPPDEAVLYRKTLQNGPLSD